MMVKATLFLLLTVALAAGAVQHTASAQDADRAHMLEQLKDTPHDDQLRLRVAAFYQLEGKSADAIELIRDGLRYNPDSFTLHYELCPLYLSVDQINRALIHAKKSIELQPLNPDAYYNLGLAYGRKGLDTDAIAAFKEAIDLNPDNAEYYFNLGVAYYNMNDYAAALSAYEHAIRIDESEARAYLNIGTIYNILNEKDKALDYLNQALDIIGPFTEEGQKIIEFIKDIEEERY